MRAEWVSRFTKPVIGGYVAVILFVGVATVATALLRNVFPNLPSSLFFCAVMLSAWRGGLVPGLMASILSSAVFILWVGPPAPIAENAWQEVPRILLLFFASLLITGLCNQHKRAQAALEQARHQLEERVAERTKALAISENKLKEAQRLARIGYWERDILTDRITWSEETCRIWGRSPANGFIIQAQLEEMIHPDDRQLQRKALIQAQQGRRPYDVEYRIVRPDGDVRFLHVWDKAEFDQSGRPIRLFGTVQDITERKRMEDALREREELMRVLTDNANDFIRLHQVDGRSVYASPSVKRLYGQWPNSIFDFAHPEDLNACELWWKQVVTEGPIPRLQWRVRDLNGQWRWLETAASRLQFRGQPHVLTVCRDITEDKRVEEQLRQAEDELRLVIDTIPVMAWTLRPDGVVDFLNRRWIEYSGLSLEQYVADPSGPIHPDDAARVFGTWRVKMADGEGYEDEMRLRRADGEYHWFLVRTAPLRDEHGQIIKWYGVSTDIEDRKRAEEAVRASQHLLELVLATLPVAVVVTNKAGDIVLANAASKRIWGDMQIVSGPERWERSKGSWHDSGERIAPTNWASVRALNHGQTSLNELIDIETYDGRRKTIQNSAAPIRDEHGQIVGAVIVNEDLTERVRAEEALRQTQAELTRMARVMIIGELTASIAHEVNQPLGAVVANANAAGRWLATVPHNVEEARKALDRIARDGNRASEVIKRIRAFINKRQPVKKPIDLNELIQETLALTQPELNRKRVALEIELTPDLPRITGDRVQLQQVLLNLVMNALDSMSTVSDRPRLLRIRTDRMETDAVRVAVQDTGGGILPQDAERVFGPFYTTKPQGLGMGLAISRSILEAHAGRLWLTSHGGSGVTFFFTLPVRHENAS